MVDNTDEERLNNPTNPQSENPQDENERSLLPNASRMKERTLDLRKVFGMVVTYNDSQQLVSPVKSFEFMK
jgi:hypothetical protein